jgi:hypothetical protein
VADFFDKLKQGLGKGVTIVSVRSKEMLDANRANSQIADIERQKRDALTELGSTVCAMLDSGHLDEEALRIARASIAKFDDQIVEKQQELARIHSDAELALAEAPEASPGKGDPATCGCGLPIAVGAKFCRGCGKSLGVS